ncbi:hypothetical protein QJS10_CPB19g01586 [Acorus calamus]|uniref:Uncharacterized protein n=1 Tax=Acorus calamus TaxID=4465 RepID=A0AAV9CL75_ACOCL|nr:hypothetical protein QJS10_CPB19g01586 [Acorus calamus]
MMMPPLFAKTLEDTEMVADSISYGRTSITPAWGISGNPIPQVVGDDEGPDIQGSPGYIMPNSVRISPGSGGCFKGQFKSFSKDAFDAMSLADDCLYRLKDEGSFLAAISSATAVVLPFALRHKYLLPDGDLSNYALQVMDMLQGNSFVDAHATVTGTWFIMDCFNASWSCKYVKNKEAYGNAFQRSGFLKWNMACVLYILRVGVADQMAEIAQRNLLVLLAKQLESNNFLPPKGVAVLRLLSYLLTTLGEVPVEFKEILDDTVVAALSHSSVHRASIKTTKEHWLDIRRTYLCLEDSDLRLQSDLAEVRQTRAAEGDREWRRVDDVALEGRRFPWTTRPEQSM